jgi:hypothetical protein
VATGAAPLWSDRLGQLILDALRVTTDAQYSAVQQAWDQITEAVEVLSHGGQPYEDALLNAKPNGGPEALHQYFQIATYVHDDAGQPIDDFFIEFFPPKEKNDDYALYFHSQVLEDVRVNSRSGARRCLFVDRDDLMYGFYPQMKTGQKQQLAMTVSATRPGPNVGFFDKTNPDAAGHVIVHRFDDDKRENLKARLYRNCPHLVEIIIPRRPVDKVFTVTR